MHALIWHAFCIVLQDARLIEGVAKYKADGWAKVAEYMGDGLSTGRCCSRWCNYLEPIQMGLKSGNWQPDEVPHPYYYCSNLYRHLTVQSLLLMYLYMTGEALVGAGATSCDPIILEHKL